MNQFEELRKTIHDVKEAIFTEMETLLETCEEDADKFYSKGNRSAGSRVRKNAQLVRKQLHFPTLRKELTKIEEAAKALRENISQSK